jgi:hypothetical protein
MNGSTLDENLEDWNTLKQGCDFSGILVGNGASRAVWDGFEYDSLYSKAIEIPTGQGLNAHDVALFDKFSTKNFEFVLSSLATARKVMSSLSLETRPVNERYKSIQAALANAVHANHIPWATISGSILSDIGDELSNYPIVYSTNYDLLIYWAVMFGNRGGFKDYFWSNAFAVNNTDFRGDDTAILHLHGGLQFQKSIDGKTYKVRSDGGGSLLDKFGTSMSDDTTPLLISEGTAEDKVRSIYKSDYLSFAHSKLIRHKGSLCVFGHGLSIEDRHIVEAINHSDAGLIAVSILPNRGIEIKQDKARLIEKFPRNNLRFFDASTHPLGKPELKQK